ncbi:MAG: class I SAM-dependent methyltransferase [Pseudomonadota bacterium]|nr:class I SAM-dependent methyltransferase [Pseudomonadota bacterium]
MIEPETTISRAAPALLRTLFLHHDGIVVGATLAALGRSGVLALLLREGRVAMHEILRACPARPGYLHVALRCLALQGWLEREGEPASDAMVFSVTPRGRHASAAFDVYREVAAFVYSGVPFSRYLFGQRSVIHTGVIQAGVIEREVIDPPFERYAELVARSAQGYGLASEEFETIRAHLDGMLAGPSMIALKQRGLLAHGEFRFPAGGMTRDRLSVVLALLQHLGWVRREPSLTHGSLTHGDAWSFTEKGRVACEFTLHYGLTLSYLPLFCQLPRLLFDSVKNVTHREPGQEETHVERTLNVLASGVAHRRYFEDADAIIREVFNREPIAEQARFVADMGCGDGVWLDRIYQLVCRETLRGEKLDEHPLVMVGADYNVSALAVARRRLEAAGVPHIALFGDITDPENFAAALREVGLAIEDGLHIRAFIDHNRRYTEPREQAPKLSLYPRRAMSTGAYADEEGRAIPNALLEQNLVEHLRRWIPYTKQHGLIIIEAHDVAPEIAWRYGGCTHATAFDTYHGYSNQYPVDFDAFMSLAEEAGLRSIPYQHKVYPSRLPFVAISLNRFKTSDPGWLQTLKPCVRHNAGEFRNLPLGESGQGQGRAPGGCDDSRGSKDVPTARPPSQPSPCQKYLNKQGERAEKPESTTLGIPEEHPGWRPDGSEDREDGETLHRFLYRDGGIEHPRRWCFASTGALVAAILDEVERRLAGIESAPRTGRALRLVDYGAGTGLATLELIHGLADKGLLKRFDTRGIAFELLVLDLPSGWFAKAHELLEGLPFVRFESLKDAATGRIRRLSEIVAVGAPSRARPQRASGRIRLSEIGGPEGVDVVFASMVLHLVQPKALPALVDGIAEALKPDGVFLWNSPDTAPAPADACVIHAANRLLRGVIAEVLDDERRLPAIIAKLPEAERALYHALPARIREITKRLTASERARLRALGDKQVLPVPTDVSEIHTQLCRRFFGATSTAMSVLSEEDVIALALLPANQRYFAEVPERDCREELIRLLLRAEVLPRLRAGPAGHPTGLNLHWTFGHYAKGTE